MRIAMIGIKAIPARFGGFETAVDELARGLVRRGHDVRVYNRSGMSSVHGNYEGVQLVTLPTVRSKSLSTIVHAFLATLHVAVRPVDVVHYFTTGTTVCAPLPRIGGMKIVCSVDGTDWQRSKWGKLARLYLQFSERLAVLFSNAIVSDSEAVKDYYRKRYGAPSFCITYGIREAESSGAEWLQRFGLAGRDYILFVGRLVPENNVHNLIRAFEQVVTSKKLVIVGDDPWEKSYIRSLKSTTDSRIVFTGAVYGEGYVQLQRNAYLFVLPDEVGGTHPALVEAMGFRNCVLVNDTPSNLEVIDDTGFSYKGSDNEIDLKNKLQFLVEHPDVVEVCREKALERAKRVFRWEQVVSDHEKVYASLVRGGSTSVEGKYSWDDRHVNVRQKRKLFAAMKRTMDIIGASVGLILTAPIFFFAVVAVALSSPGPIFYRWRVVGERGKKFVSYKFRSMYQDADARKNALLDRNEMRGPVFKIANDPRITPVGRVLRKFSIDELPQLWSVLKGDMSLVGPRPPLQSEYEHFSEWQKLKLQVKPGITCLWQVGGRNGIADFNDWVKLDLEYIENWSLMLDVKILISTIPAVLLGKGR